MATTINAYSVSLGLDASNFVDGTKVSRSEFRQLTRDIEAAQTPMEKYAVEQDRLKRALDSGAISQATYDRLLKAKQAQLPGITAAMAPYIAGIAAVGAGLAAAGAATAAFVSHMRDVQGQIDDTADAATRLGVTFTELKTLQFGFQEGAGIDAKTVEDSVKKLQINLAKAVEGDEGIRGAFAKLGLDAGELIGVGPQEAVLRIADAMEGVSNHADRLKLSMEIFGKAGADLASTLGEGRDSLAGSMEFAEKWLGLTDQQVAMVGANNDQWDRIGVIVEGITTQVAAELAPAMELVADIILSTAGSFEGVSEFIAAWVDGMVEFAGVAHDVNQLVYEIASNVKAVSTLDIDNIKQLSEEAMTFDTADKWLAELANKRRAAAEDAMEAEKKREQARHAMAMEDTDKEKKSKLDAIDKAAKEEERLRKEAEREQRQAAQNALQAAERYFEEERKRQMKLRDDVAAGPGSGMDVGGAEAARFMAQQANQAIADAAVQVDAKPTDEQLVEQAKIQVEIARAAKAKQDEMLSKIQGVADAIKENGWEAV